MALFHFSNLTSSFDLQNPLISDWNKLIVCSWFHLIYNKLFMHLGVKKASQGTYPGLYMTLNSAPILTAPPVPPVSGLLHFALFSASSCRVPGSHTRGPEHTLLTVHRWGRSDQTAVSHHTVTGSAGNNWCVHIQGKAYKKSHAPVYPPLTAKEKATGPKWHHACQSP